MRVPPMALSAGARLGIYEVISLLGRGGMGEVYRARDTRLGRDVALKLLPASEDVHDPHRRARLEREARALAALTHPNIAAIYGLHDEGSPQAATPSTIVIVMELVEGETLDDRLQRGPLPLEDALGIASQIADALEAAHQKGIVHRDLKPANVKITPAGTVKVLDFGLAKFLTDSSPEDVTLAMTAPAVVLGTPAYMAPEQAQGRSADRRVDVWGFGVVLYEMVTGERPFRGDSVQETLAAVLTADPEWTRVPPPVRPLVRACLERDPARRLRDIADHRFLLAPPDAVARLRPSPARWLWIAGAALAIVLLGLYAATSLPRERSTSALAGPVRLSTMLPEGVSVTRGPGYTSSVAVSPDGLTLIIAATDTSGQRLYRRSLDRLVPSPLAGTDRGSSPFFSADGKWIGFFADGRVKRVPAAGGAPIDIAAAGGFPAGASWGPDNRIVFAYGADSHLHVVSSEGGDVVRMTDATGRQPDVLPDGRTVLFESDGHVHSYDRQNGAITKLLAGTAPRYANGHVIFGRGTTLLAAPFDLDTLAIGTATPVAEGVAIELPGSGGGAHYAISPSGTLAYVPAADAYELVVLGPNGVERVVGQPEHSLQNPRFSPDGRLVVVAAGRGGVGATDLRLHDLDASTVVRLTSSGGRAAVWSADGTTITYSHLGAEPGIYSTRIDGGGDQRLVLPLKAFHWLVGWTPEDPSTLLYGLMMGDSGSSIMAYSNGSSRTVVGPGNNWGGRLSRDGKWLAYYVLNSGTFEVYVTPFPSGGSRWLIAEGTDPSWTPDGNELYYRSGPQLLAARLEKTAGVRVTGHRLVLDSFLPPLYDDYDIHLDGRTLAAVRPVNGTQSREVTMVLGWFSEFGETRR
ncbi:MAG TPA: protein kinase [Vicinamibacterales bacterium]|nr:protein kinase [Vicinamibacterales bacterium]